MNIPGNWRWLACLLWVSCWASAQPFPPVDNLRYNTTATDPSRPYDPVAGYGAGAVTWRAGTPEQGDPVVVVDMPDASRWQIALRPIMGRATELWNARLQEAGVAPESLHISESPLSGTLHISTSTDPTIVPLTAYASTYTPGGGPLWDMQQQGINLSPGIYFRPRIAISAGQWAALAGNFPPGANPLTILQTLYTYIAVHEMGHALGLDHPNVPFEPNPDNPLADERGSVWVHIWAPGLQSMQAPIMLSQSLEYLRRRVQELGRPLQGPEDVAISIIEAQLVNVVVRQCLGLPNLPPRGNITCAQYGDFLQRVDVIHPLATTFTVVNSPMAF